MRAASKRVTRVILVLLIAASIIAAAQSTRPTGNEQLVGDFFPYESFAKLAMTRMAVPGGQLSVAIAPGETGLTHEAILTWVKQSVDAVASYFGRLPDANSRLLIVPTTGSGISGGVTYGYGGAASRIAIGRNTTQAQLARDWVLVHELTHHGFPSVPDDQHWMEEGMATYVEPIARAQLGQLSAQRVWGDMVDGLPKGLPRDGDEGLDRTHTWGRTYWGGALFYLLADVEIRRQTGNRRGLQDALRAVVAADGNISHSWPVAKILATGDQGTGTHVLEDLYAQLKEAPAPTDLAELWQRLGVKVQDGAVSFDDTAPLAAIRRAITAPAHPG